MQKLKKRYFYWTANKKTDHFFLNLGMAYGLLGNVDPIRHNSLGTFVVVCLMTGKSVLEHSNLSECSTGSTSNTTIAPDLLIQKNCYSPIQVATAVTFMVAIFQLMMYTLRLGAISNLISETMVGGFTTGAAVHVLTSQTYISLFHEITNINLVAMSISAVTIELMLLNNEILKPRVAKKCSFPISIELLVIVLGTFSSYVFNLSVNHGIATGEVPKRLPLPMAQPFSLMDKIMMDSFIIAVVSYTINLSMGMIFAQKLGYEVDANQELLAQDDTYYSWSLMKSFSPGCLIRIQGVPPRNGSRFEISLQCGADVEKVGCAFLLTVCFDNDSFLVNKCYVPEKGWQQEQRYDDIDITPGEKFEIVVQCEGTKFIVALNGEYVSEFAHVIPFTNVKLAEIRGDVTLSLISYEDCTIPGSYKIEGGYPLMMDS